MENETEKEPVRIGRPKKEIAQGRARFSTMLQPSLIKWLKHYSAEHGITAADILENALNLYKYEQERKK
jgi:hypothetical protein